MHKEKKWKSPFTKPNIISYDGGEPTLFMFNNQLHSIENFVARAGIPDVPCDYRFHEDGFRIRNLTTDTIISVPLLNHYFATATVWQNEVYIFCGDYEWDRPWWTIRNIVMIKSSDLVTWTAPTVALEAEGDERLFNNAVAYDGKRFVMLYETNDKNYVPFSFKFAQSYDLVHWEKLDQALYGANKYVGGPAMYFENGYFYVLYVNSLDGLWDTRITRSKDLVNWEDAPEDRPFLSPDPTHLVWPERFPGVTELNASDAELIEIDNKVIVRYLGGNQSTCCDLKEVEYNGTRQELLEHFFN